MHTAVTDTTMRRLSEHQLSQVLSVVIAPVLLSQCLELPGIDPAEPVGNLLGHGDLQPLARLNSFHEVGCLQQTVGRTGVQPGHAPAQRLDVQKAMFQVLAVQVSYLQLPTRRGPEFAGEVDRPLVIEVQAGDGKWRLGRRGFLLDADGAAAFVELDDAVAFRVPDVVAEHGGALALLVDALQYAGQAAAVEDVVAQYQRNRPAVDELLGDQQRLGDPGGLRLLGVTQFHAPLAAVAEQLLERRGVAGRGDDHDLADACEHQDGQGVVDQRLVVHGQQLLADDPGGGPQPAAGAACQDDAFAAAVDGDAHAVPQPSSPERPGSSAVRPETLLQLLPAAAVPRDVFRQLHRRAGAARGFHAGSAFACQLERAAAPAGDVQGVIGDVLDPADRQRDVRRQHIDVILAGEQVFERP